ncbi:MAG: class E sortase [Haloechinothrix sp.]
MRRHRDSGYRPDPEPETRVFARPDFSGEPTQVFARLRPAAPGTSYLLIRSLGELLITAGVIVLLFVFYTLYVTNWESARKQADARAGLDDSWSQQRQVRPELTDGEAFARIYIPSFGADYQFTIQEGVGAQSLEVGPGHYPDTAMPGEPGNVGVAGHRVGKGAPFNDLDLLNPCDAIVIETATAFFVYRVLPMTEQVPDWARVRQSNPKCANVSTLRQADQPGGGPYGETVGRRIVTPDRGDAVAAVPYRLDDPLAKTHQASLLTLTTCHPRFSDRERMIIHAMLTNQESKSSGGGYQDLLTKIGEA